MTAHVRTLGPFGMAARMNPRRWRQSVEKRLNSLLERAMGLITSFVRMFLLY